MCFTGRVGRLTGICILKLSRAANTTRKLGLGAWGDFCNICFRLRRGLYNPRDRARFLNVGPAFYAGPGNLQVHGEVAAPCRSEEHTSELQSHVNLVCRLLLEKKKKNKKKILKKKQKKKKKKKKT